MANLLTYVTYMYMYMYICSKLVELRCVEVKIVDKKIFIFSCSCVGM
jgi:hypothetical protein